MLERFRIARVNVHPEAESQDNILDLNRGDRFNRQNSQLLEVDWSRCLMEFAIHVGPAVLSRTCNLT